MRAEEFVESYFDAWNHRDAQGVAAHLTANGVYCDIPEHARHSQRELVSYLDDFFAGNRLEYRLVGDILADASTIAFQYEILPASQAADSHESAALRGAEFITLGDDAALTIMDYYDVSDRPQPSALGHINARQVRRRKYAKSGLDDRRLAVYRARLDRIMRSERLYLRPDITLPRLAKAVDCSVNHLSQVINAGFGMSFFDYLNRHRIVHALELLSGPDSRDMPILNIAFSAGFNSNSAFYAAFKRCIGQTPAEYRKQVQNRDH